VKILRTQEFIEDIKKIKDEKSLTIITQRLVRLADGNFGDSHSVGGGVSELRLHSIGYRIYYAMRGKEVVILLCGGGKSGQGKAQNKDIKKAQNLAKEV
jgi:putative addiction module killer protein